MSKILSTRYTDAAFNIAVLLWRVTFGLLLCINHGLDKMKKFEKISHTFFDPFHIGSQWSLILVLFAEVFCALFVVLGLFTRVATIPVLITMGIAVFLVHAGQPFVKSEMALLYMVAFFGILLVGPGKYSVDAAMGK